MGFIDLIVENGFIIFKKSTIISIYYNAFFMQTAMADLIREGKILHWGISEATEDYLRRAHRWSIFSRYVLHNLGVNPTEYRG